MHRPLTLGFFHHFVINKLNLYGCGNTALRYALLVLQGGRLERTTMRWRPALCVMRVDYVRCVEDLFGPSCPRGFWEIMKKLPPLSGCYTVFAIQPHTQGGTANTTGHRGYHGMLCRQGNRSQVNFISVALHCKFMGLSKGFTGTTLDYNP